MKFELYKHQKVTIKFLIQNQKCFCWNATGTGKTLCCVLAYKILRKYGKKKVLILCTLSTVYDVWGKEFFNVFLMDLKIGYLIGSKKKRITELNKNYDVYIINHDGLKTIFEELVKWSPDIVIVDEHTAFKNSRSDRWKFLNRFCKEIEFIIMMSGTPCSQAPTDLYAPARIVCPELVGRSFIRFRDKVMCQVSMYKWIPKENWEYLIRDFPVIRFKRSDCIDLPSVVKQTIHVELSNKQKNTFKTLKKDAVAYFDDHEVTAVNEGVMRTKLLQCCCGFVYSTLDANAEKKIINLEPATRLQAIEDLIEECERGVLIFATFSSAIDSLLEFVKRRCSCEKVDGSVGVKERGEIFNKFQLGEIKVIIAHPKTMAHGVTLTYADTVIWYLVSSDAELYEQANGRINRIGQQYKMRVIHLVSTSLEEKVLARLEQKQSMQGLLLEFLEEKI